MLRKPLVRRDRRLFVFAFPLCFHDQKGGKDPKPPKKKTEFDVELTNFGSQKVKVIKAIREITGLGLREAKEFVEAAPKIIKDGVSIEEAEALKAKFEELGAAITLK